MALALGDTTGYRGDQGHLDVRLPRLEAQARIDGALDDPAWTRAARLSGFSQFSPIDGVPAQQRTEVLVWYSPTALYFGIRAWAEPGTVRAHLGDRDKGIIPDDYIELQLGTFNDGRQVFVFGANPLGVQADGTLIEGTGAGTASNGERPSREQADLSPRLRLGLQGATDRLRLRDRDPDSFSGSPLSAPGSADLDPSDHPEECRQRAGRHLGTRPSGGGLVRGPGRAAGGAHPSPPGVGAGAQPGRDLHRGGGSAGRR